MKSQLLVTTLFLALIGLVLGAAPSHELNQVKEVPGDLAKPIASRLKTPGYRVAGPDGPVCTVWLAKDIAVKPDFEPGFYVKYPFQPGQLIGVLRVPEKTKFTDFRGQELSPGVYTLRYGQQPQDGNHIGTSATADFLLALPAKLDKQPKTMGDYDELTETSAKSAGSTHPAIFSMVPIENGEAPEKATLEHDSSDDFWILSVPVPAKEKDKSVTIPMKFVVIGRTFA